MIEKKTSNLWIKENKSWVQKNVAYFLLLIAVIGIVSLFIHLLMMPNLTGGFNIVRYCIVAFLVIVNILLFGIAVYAIWVLVADWFKCLIARIKK